MNCSTEVIDLYTAALQVYVVSAIQEVKEPASLSHVTSHNDTDRLAHLSPGMQTMFVKKKKRGWEVGGGGGGVVVNTKKPF